MSNGSSATVSGNQGGAFIWWDPLTWVNGIQNGAQAVVNWLGGLGGNIASGIEGGFIAVLKDIWNAIYAQLLIGLGMTIALLVLLIYFKDQAASAILRIVLMAVK